MEISLWSLVRFINEVLDQNYLKMFPKNKIGFKNMSKFQSKLFDIVESFSQERYDSDWWEIRWLCNATKVKT